MASSLQHVDHASPLEDVITETEATSKEPPTVPPPAAALPPPPPENAKTADVEDEEDLEDLTAPPYEQKVGNSDDEDAEYSSLIESEEAAPPFSYGEESATFDDFNEVDDPEHEDDVV